MDIRVEFESWVSGRMITAEKIVSALGVGVGGREGRREGEREREGGMEGMDKFLPAIHACRSSNIHHVTNMVLLM